MPEIIGIGTDIEEISRFQKHISANNSVSGLIGDIFSGEEIGRNFSFKNPYICFALGFSCKESVFKALGRSWMNALLVPVEIECLFLSEPENNELEIRLSGDALKLFGESGGKKIEGESETRGDHVLFRVIIWK